MKNYILSVTFHAHFFSHFLFHKALTEKAKSVAGIHQWPYRAVATALEIIPRTLIQNCGGNVIRTLTALKVRNKSSLIIFKVLFNIPLFNDNALFICRRSMPRKETTPGE